MAGLRRLQDEDDPTRGAWCRQGVSARDMLESPQVASGASADAPLIRVEGVTKSFGAVRALRGVNFELRPGEVHALLGENGAGKSTLIKVLSGVQRHDSGIVEIGGRRVAFQSPAQSRKAGITVVYQELSLVGSLSVAANLMLGREPRTKLGFLKKRRLMTEASAFLQTSGIPLDPRASVDSLPFAYRQMTEIGKALMGNVRVLILDEPTSALTDQEEQILFDAVRKVTQQGVGVIYVTHRLGEVFRIADRVTVLRDGINVGLFETARTDMKQLVAAIVGPGHIQAAPTTGQHPAGQHPAGPVAPTSSGPDDQPALKLSRVANDRLRGVDLTLQKGEIHGLAGLVGSGRTEILETVFGLRGVEAGEISIDGSAVTNRSPADAISAGVALVPEDRHEQGLVLGHSIERNLTLPRLAALSRWGWLRQRAAVQQAKAAMAALRVKASGPSTVLQSLSGGNQQKVVFAKWNRPRSRVLLLDEPTVGVDVGAREEIYALIREAAQEGSGVLVVSSDLAELMLLCDRISIVVDGRVGSTIARGDLDSTEDLHHLIQTSPPPSGLAA